MKNFTILGISASIALLFFSYLMFIIIYPYLIPPFPTDIDFLLTKQRYIFNQVWMVSFYVHISTSLFIMVAGLAQFSRWILRSYPKLHRQIGMVYVVLILGFSAPSGLVMAYYANGGIAAQLAFIALSLAWFWFTTKAYTTARAHDWDAHGAYMLRSYALTLSAITLRAYNWGFGYFHAYHSLDYRQIYILISWAGWMGNLLLAEFLIAQGYTKWLMKKS